MVGPNQRISMILKARARVEDSSADASRYKGHRIGTLPADGEDDDPDLAENEWRKPPVPEAGGRPVHATTEWRHRKRWLDLWSYYFHRQGMTDANATARTNAQVDAETGLWRRRCTCGLEFLAKHRKAKYAPGHDRCRKRVDQDRLDPASRIRWNRP